MVSEKKIFEGSLATRFYINLWHLGSGQFRPQGLDWQDLSRGTLHTATYKYISCGPHGFREEDFLGFSHFKPMGANDPRGTANLD